MTAVLLLVFDGIGGQELLASPHPGRFTKIEVSALVGQDQDAARHAEPAEHRGEALVAEAEAKRDVETTAAEPVPMHLRNAPTRLMKDLGYGRGYQHAHEFEDAVVEMEGLPDGLRGRRFYRPTDRGFEAEVGGRMARRGDILADRLGRRAGLRLELPEAGLVGHRGALRLAGVALRLGDTERASAQAREKCTRKTYALAKTTTSA